MENIQELNVYAVSFYEGKVLIVKLPNDLWEFPGGSVDWGEQPIDAARRELTEETGLSCSNLELICISSATYKKNGKSKHSVYIVYKTTVNSNRVVLSHEHTEYRWVSVPELKFLKLGLNAENVLDYIQNQLK